MCYRYVKVDPRDVAREARLEAILRKPLPKEGDLFTGGEGIILRPSEEGGRELVAAKWGLTPHWAKSETFGRKNAYNARSETVHEKPTFRNAFKSRRCIVPASAFYEQDEGRWKRVMPTEDPFFAIAGLWEPANEVSGNDTFTMVTVESNPLRYDINDRMPVILPFEAIEDWMAPDAPFEGLKALMGTCPADWLRIEDDGEVERKKKSEPALF